MKNASDSLHRVAASQMEWDSPEEIHTSSLLRAHSLAHLSLPTRLTCSGS